MQGTYEIALTGQVQGVGFRPFVYHLAKRFGLEGYVCNKSIGVVIRINASKEEASSFLSAVRTEAPRTSIITSFSLEKIGDEKYTSFEIQPSRKEEQIDIPLTPDFAICEDCKADIRNPENRRFAYPFTTCTNCGPRYSITKTFPFERAHTTIDAFAMCSACRQEYQDPDDRRFHSQTNTCSQCGITLQLTSGAGKDSGLSQPEIIAETARLLSSGAIIAIKNTNGYLLCCDANDAEAIARLRQKKRRPAKPFALLFPNISYIKSSFQLSLSEEKAVSSAEAPIVLLKPKGKTDLKVEEIAPNLSNLGCMLPSSALLTLLMDEVDMPLVATSGNIHGSPIIATEEEAKKKLSEVADHFLDHDLTISFPQDDSVVRFVGDQKIILRRARGMAPNYLAKSFKNEEATLAMGAHLKSSFAFVPNSHTYVSPYFGNLDSFEVLTRFEKSIEAYENLFEKKADVILVDKHPQYQSSIFGKEMAAELEAEIHSFQHHKAHFASVLGEHDLFDTSEKVLGVIWDGTGLGDDGAIWGGEFFSYNRGSIDRFAHFEYSNWIAGDKMAKEPRLSLLCYLPEDLRENYCSKFSEMEWKIYEKSLSSNALKTSSVGRLFDAVASMLGLIDVASYEGEAAMLLEAVAEEYQGNEFIDFLADTVSEPIPTKIILRNVHQARSTGIPKDRISNSFIHTLALLIVKFADRKDFRRIACSGGVFQNAVLSKKLIELTSRSKMELFLNRFLSCNDENISFGQLCCHQYLKD